MRKTLLFFVVYFLSNFSIAQISSGGLPLSVEGAYISYINKPIPVTTLPAPPIDALIQEDSITAQQKLKDQPLRIGALVAADISFPSSGDITVLPGGGKIWRAAITIAGANAIGLYYDRFQLPNGVKLFLYNGNGKQILGSFTAENNTDGNWATEKVEGEQVTIEMDIDANVNTADIKLHINNVCDFYKSIGYLEQYKTDNGGARTTSTYFAYGHSSPCEVNAVCPQGAGFPDQRKATVHIEYLSGAFAYAGTGTLMNNTNRDCVPYVLTASHVERTNSKSDITFSSWIFYFNYETPTCTYSGSQPASSQTMVGAYFKSRSSYDSASNSIVGDFLLVQLKSYVPSSYGAYLSGWDHSGITPTGTVIGFHHPFGDVKKLSTATGASPLGDFNGGEANSHWQVTWTVGGIEEGSSGSGLFNNSGRLIGDLSGGYVYLPSCTTPNAAGDTMSTVAEYSKLSLNWLYVYQIPTSSSSRLKDWLDPTNSGVLTLDALAATCAVSTGTQAISNNETSVIAYPNPTKGVVNLDLAFPVITNCKVEVYDIIGDKKLETDLAGIRKEQFQVDLSAYQTGFYFIKVSTGSGDVVVKKVLLSK